eukprot:11045397-Heterocapsa_arctica.AAC.1
MDTFAATATSVGTRALVAMELNAASCRDGHGRTTTRLEATGSRRSATSEPHLSMRRCLQTDG